MFASGTKANRLGRTPFVGRFPTAPVGGGDDIAQ